MISLALDSFGLAVRAVLLSNSLVFTVIAGLLGNDFVDLTRSSSTESPRVKARFRFIGGRFFSEISERQFGAGLAEMTRGGGEGVLDLVSVVVVAVETVANEVVAKGDG